MPCRCLLVKCVMLAGVCPAFLVDCASSSSKSSSGSANTLGLLIALVCQLISRSMEAMVPGDRVHVAPHMDD